MRNLRLLLSLLALLFIGGKSFAQESEQKLKLGLKISPVFSFNRLDDNSSNFDISPGGTSTKLAFGLVADKPFGDNYYFSTGIIYLPKGAKIEARPEDGGGKFKETYKTHYLQVPLTVKLLTNPITDELRAYAQLGGTVDFLINQETGGNQIIDKFFFMDVALVLGGGITYDLSFGNTIGLGLVYQRGLINAASKGEDIRLKKDLLMIDLAFYF
ncbi:porin family protein [Persicobacter diffluens]|uniref:Outer membrane protein beta-barrel domain-containing protein n=1 Tax=Persicobacter diffluens TaxID=981 RepID=A0AAN4W2J7_9BACT|nr:hypothetical protein PEDI_40780 [Persicobacter diffluens]